MDILYGTSPDAVIGEKEIAEASATLQKYKDCKANLETRIVDDELWWELRHWEAIRGKQRGSKTENGDITPEPRPTSAWLFNAIMNKHADMMDNYPQPIVLPRERSDEESAKTLSEVLPVIFECNGFDKVYSNVAWEKLKHGTGAYTVLWDKDKENGLGDISINQLDLLKVFWEPGITDIQDSRNLFIVDLIDEDVLNAMYPEFDGKLRGQDITVPEYKYDDTIDLSDKAMVVDWYYKRKLADGRTLVHLAKFCGKYLLYSSENDPMTKDTGIYDHGMYPVVFDALFPEKGTPVGFGYVAICKDPQMYVDRLYANIIESSLMGSKKRFFVSSSTNINEEEFMDWNRPIVHVEGELSDARIQEIVCQPLSNMYVEIANLKIDELKETSGNRDVNSGGSASGLTAASAIAALQEAGNKSSRDLISASYRAFADISRMALELIRQFYDETRSFRITAPNGIGDYEFVDISNKDIGIQQTGVDALGNILYRKPIFDLKVKAEKTNPFSRMEQNERAKELYAMGFFAPENAQASMLALDAMNFEGIEKIKEKVAEGATLYNMLQQMSQQLAMLQAAVGMNPAMSAPAPQEKPKEAPKAKEDKTASGIMEANTPMTSYGQRLAERSTPSVNA